MAHPPGIVRRGPEERHEKKRRAQRRQECLRARVASCLLLGEACVSLCFNAFFHFYHLNNKACFLPPFVLHPTLIWVFNFNCNEYS